MNACHHAQVLLASGNQLRNLDKQLALLSRQAAPGSLRHLTSGSLGRFPFLKKLELFDNPVRDFCVMPQGKEPRACVAGGGRARL